MKYLSFIKYITICVLSLFVFLPINAQKKTHQRARTTHRTVATTSTVSITDPMVVNGHLAFLGIDVTQSRSAIAQQLKAKGFVEYKNENSPYPFYKGMAYGVKCDLSINQEDENRNINYRELKRYKLSAAKARLNALANALLKASGGKVTDKYIQSDQGLVKIEGNNWYIEIMYANEDEVNFTSAYNTIYLTFYNYYE